MATRRLTVKPEAANFQLQNDFAIAKPCQPAHSGGYHNGVFAPNLTAAWQRCCIIAFTAGLDELPCHVACNFERLGHCAPLRNKSGQFVRCGKKQASRQFFHLHANRELHIPRSYHRAM
jgi:hypothetical protein